MELLLDIFGFLTVMLRGLSLTAQSIACGGAIIIGFLAYPLATKLGAVGLQILNRCAKVTVISAFALVVFELITLSIQVATLTGTLNIGLDAAIGAGFVQFNGLVTIAAFAIGMLCWSPDRRRINAALAAVLLMMAASVGTSHAAARGQGQASRVVDAQCRMEAW